MGLFSRSSEPIDEELKRVLGGFTNSDLFREKLEAHGLSRNTPNRHYKQILKSEFELGEFDVYEVENKLDQLLDENLTSKELSQRLYSKLEALQEPIIHDRVNELLSRGRVGIRVPDKMDAIHAATMGSIAFGSTGATLGALTGGEVVWKSTDLIITDDGLTIHRTGQGIVYDDISHVQIAQLDNFHIPIVNVSSKYGTNNLTFACLHAKELKIIIEDKLPKDESDKQTEEDNQLNDSNADESDKQSEEDNQLNDSNADELLKYAELFEKGLITQEEFDTKKKELL